MLYPQAYLMCYIFPILGCVNHLAEEFEAGDTYTSHSNNKCFSCSCVSKNGDNQAECYEAYCPTLTCSKSEQTKIAGTCCSKCPERKRKCVFCIDCFLLVCSCLSLLVLAGSRFSLIVHSSARLFMLIHVCQRCSCLFIFVCLCLYSVLIGGPRSA